MPLAAKHDPSNAAAEPASDASSTVMCAFLIKEARQYLDMANMFAVYEGNTLIGHRLEPGQDSTP